MAALPGKAIVGARAQAKAEKEADDVQRALCLASQGAIDTCLANINEKLRSNVPLMYHLGALLQNEEWTATLLNSVPSTMATANSGDKPGSNKNEKPKMLLASVKKLKDLGRHIAIYRNQHPG